MLIRDGYAPLQSGVTGFGNQFASFTSIFSNKQELLRQIQDLQQQNQSLQQENQALNEYRAEALRLQSLLAFANDNLEQYSLMPARVIARSPSNWYQVVVIDRGTANGVRLNMAVLSPEGLVGRVSAVSNRTAQVNLLTDRAMAVGAIAEESRETRGIVEGLGDNNLLRMANIPYYSTINVGERIISSGLSEIYPKGAFIGTVTEITGQSGGLLKSAVVQPAVDFDKLEEVLLIIADFNAAALDRAAE